MQVTVIAVGKVKEKFLQDGILEYSKRLRSYLNLDIIEIPEEKRPVTASPAVETAAVEKEGERILSAIPSGALTIALEIQGKRVSSEGFAEMFREWELSGKSRIAFIIGGDLGLSKKVLSQSDLTISLSSMTFTHQMARLFLIEQIYRSLKIVKGEPYHK